MRRILGVVAALVCVGLLCSCSGLGSPAVGLYDDSTQQSKEEMQRIADAIEEHDAEALKELFSPRAVENATDLDDGLEYFLSVFESGEITWKSSGTNSSSHTEGFKETLALYCNFTVVADGEKYELYFNYYPKNEIVDPHNVGIYALGVTPFEKDRVTASGEPKPFFVWRGSFKLRDGVTEGDPGVYIPQS